MTEGAHDDPVAGVDALVAAIGPRLDPPPINLCDVVLVTGPWMAGVSGVVAALRERLPQHKFVESTDLGPGDAPLAVVFVVSAAAHLTGSDCALLDAAAEHTDVVVCVVAKIDVHHTWRDVLAANRDALAAHAPRYAQVPWVGAAAMPELGEVRVDDLVDAVSAQLADSDIARRNRLRAWESRLQTVAQRFDHDAEGAGRQARVDALREARSTALRERRQSKTERSITLRGQIQQARVQLSYFARNRCTSVRGELQEDAAALSRRKMGGFEGFTRGRAEQVVAEVSEGTDTHLADVAEVMGVPLALPASRAAAGGPSFRGLAAAPEIAAAGNRADVAARRRVRAGRGADAEPDAGRSDPSPQLRHWRWPGRWRALPSGSRSPSWWSPCAGCCGTARCWTAGRAR